MKKTYNGLISLLLTLVLVCSCSSDDKLGDSITKIPQGPKTELDKWIRTNFTEPHNIEVIYKWVDEETELGKNLIPPEEQLILPFLEILKEVWIDTYIEKGGLTFFNKLTPKQIQLIGSPNINNDGTITQGTAEAGIKIVLYEVNKFNTENKKKFLRFFHVIHHEFAHITHQNIMFDNSVFGEITPGGYRSDWMNLNDTKALELGFITPYASMNSTEDFVEIVATILTTSPTEFKNLINSVENTTGKEALKMKIDFVVNYYKKEWNIDLYDFQIRMDEVIEDILNRTK